ncbi:CaiB/BaiF CoA transferase family protein [Sphingopyxis sp. FD7]|uniref:CaiB/BaiF CoA transferase family protein n=1 Tax=Sphingopyxis sp. FD7 TaxID=1914525 RepID=UPI000DC62F33|nr:CoA transferase [Sphingopyxis sp. FD7]BBB14540.1 L-carnitine dehydratase/bile acid-inducible protein [Sphingopyxis sp. FD7]
MSAFRSPKRQGPAGPLSGIKVLDLSAYIAGPYGCTLLADQGADVIKVEPPAGDNLRQYPSTLEGENRAYLGVNRSKRGVVLDLKIAADHRVLLDLLEDADVLVHNFRPGVPERLGIGYAELSLRFPRLIYCAVSGYGESGPMAQRAGYDQVLQAMTGMCALQGKADGPPELIFGSPVDYYAAALVAAGVASALYERERSGQGQSVGISLLRSALTMQSARLVQGRGERHDVSRDMRSGGITGLHPTASGWLYLSANTPHFWRALCERTGLSDLAEDPAFDSVTKRAQHADKLVARLRAVLRNRTAEEWEALLVDAVPCSVVRSVEDMFAHPQVAAEDLVATIEHPTLGSYQGVTRPIKYSRTPGPMPFAAPILDEDGQDLRAGG